MREEQGTDPIRQDEIDRHLAAAGFAVDDRLRWMLELTSRFSGRLGDQRPNEMLFNPPA
ncbi:hypothetical protein [Sphingomonas sanguinis]|uniref:hypothetical protein n=1 Tax=Sphingomonas sanguinis TaxID=33051 RepID=UPI000A52203A|nr:hypothetical protein [Sphingomonas sanguinis]